MSEFLMAYGSALAAWVCLGGLYLVQAIVADVAGIRARHTPGMPVSGGHDQFLFRATRAQANTNENLGAFVVLDLGAMLLGASAWWITILTWGFVGARLAHMLAYYADLRLLRSGAFTVGFACLVGLLVTGIAAVG